VNHQAGHSAKTYGAPWGTMLIVMSAVVTLMCVGISAGASWMAAVKHQPSLVSAAALLPLALLAGCALFTVRGFAITSDAILVNRLLWDTRLPRAGLESASVEPDVMRGSLRTLGNGGAFSFTGLYYNKRLRSYRAFVTDLHRTVVLRYASRTVVLSPDAPEDFVRDLELPEPK
jgi:hypothetical protein